MPAAPPASTKMKPMLRTQLKQQLQLMQFQQDELATRQQNARRASVEEQAAAVCVQRQYYAT